METVLLKKKSIIDEFYEEFEAEQERDKISLFWLRTFVDVWKKIKHNEIDVIAEYEEMMRNELKSLWGDESRLVLDFENKKAKAVDKLGYEFEL